MNQQETPKAEAAERAEGIPKAERGKNIFSRLYERVKSSEVVQNVVDRVKIWTNSAFSKWYEGDLAERHFVIDKERRDQGNLRKNAEENTEALRKLIELGSGLASDQTINKVRAEITSLEERAKAKESVIVRETEAAGRVEEKVNIFKEKAEAARERIGDRISDKINAHNKNLKVAERVISRAEIIIGQQRAEIEACEKKIAEAEALSGGVNNKEILALKKEVIEGLKKKEERHLAVIARQDGIIETSEKRRTSLETSIKSLLKKHSDILGVKEESKKAGGETFAAESLIVDSQPDSPKIESMSKKRFSREDTINALRKKTNDHQGLYFAAQCIAMGLESNRMMGEPGVTALLVDNLGGLDYQSRLEKMNEAIQKYWERDDRQGFSEEDRDTMNRMLSENISLLVNIMVEIEDKYAK